MKKKQKNQKKNVNFFDKVIYLLDDQIKKIPFLFFLFILLSLLDVIGLGLIIPYVGLIINPDEFYSSQIAIYFNIESFNIPLDNLIIYIGLIIFGIFLIKGIGSILINYFILSFSAYQSVRLGTKLMSSFQSMPYSIYTERNSSEYIYSINSLAPYFALICQGILKIAVEIILGIAIFILLALSNISILLILAFLITGAAYLYDSFFKRKLEKYGRRRNHFGTRQVKAVSEGLSGFKEIKILGQESYFFSEVKENIQGFSKYYVKSNLVIGSIRFFVETILVFFVVSTVVFYITSEFSLQELVPTLALFGLAAVRLAPSANQIMSGISQIRSSMNGLDLLYKDIHDLNELSFEISSQLADKKIKFNKLKLEDVSFSYKNTKKNTITNINLEINNGDIIGIMGPSGSGKTTLIDIILGLLPQSSGSIKLNGIDLKSNPRLWQSQIAYLPQEIFIMDKSLQQNITLSLDDSFVNKVKLDESIKMSQLEDLTNNLPNGIDTIIGEKGIRLSGGQRQRIALARSFYFERDILIFDEATSALDSVTEKEIMSQISGLKGIKTIILIAHRLSTLSICNKIFKLKEGKVIKTGTYEEVVNNSD